MDTARIYTLPDEPPPVYVSAFGPKALDLAARIGDGFINTADDAEAVASFKEKSGGKPCQGGVKVAWADTEDEGVDHAHRLWANAGLPGELAQVLPSPQHFEQASRAGDPRVDRREHRRRQRRRRARRSSCRTTWTPGTTRCTSPTWGRTTSR